ncbi:hypothetical protein DsansV1_C08g0078221 [Dioscorea sansibarensis]
MIVAGNLFGRWLVVQIYGRDACILYGSYMTQKMNFDLSICTMPANVPPIRTSNEPISACTLYHERGPEPWLWKTSTDAWLSSRVAEAVDGNGRLYQSQGAMCCLICYVSGRQDIYEVSSFRCVFSVDNFISETARLVVKHICAPSWNLRKLRNKI